MVNVGRSLVLIFTAVILAFSQDVSDAVRPWWGMKSPAGRAGGMGFSYSSQGGDYLSILYNPASIAIAARPSVYLAFNQFNFYSETDFFGTKDTKEQSGGSFDGFGAVIPIDVYKGHLAIAGGFSPVIVLDDYWKFSGYNTEYEVYQSENRSQEGLINSFHLGSAIEFRRDFFIGATIHWLKGYSRFNYQYVENDTDDIYTFDEYYETLDLKLDYSGLRINIGCLYFPVKIIKFGFNYQFPVNLKTSERSVMNTRETWDQHPPDESSEDYRIKYHTRLPSVFTVGLGIHLEPVKFSSQITYRNWSKITFDSKLLNADSTAFIDDEINNAINRMFVPGVDVSFGAEMSVIPDNLYTQVGYMVQPYYEKPPEENEHYMETYSIGIRWIIDGEIDLNISYMFYTFPRRFHRESYYDSLLISSSTRRLNLAVNFVF